MISKPETKSAVGELIASAVKNAAVESKAVRVYAKCIADTMREMHGGDWMFDIDHEAGFVLIQPFLKRERERRNG